MKNTILLTIMLVLVSTLSYSAPSQHTITGNMGVGVTSPEADLDVAGTIKTDTSVEFADGSTQSTAATPDGNNFRLGTAKYDSVSISTQDSNPHGIRFKIDGTKLYEIGSNGQNIYEYECSTAWEISSCSYLFRTLSMQDFSPFGLAISTDGTKIYEVGANGDNIYQYSCTTPWLITSCSYDSVSINTQDSLPTGIEFKHDGRKLYEIGYDADSIYQYSCDIPWDLNSCSYDSININTQSTRPEDIAISSDGKRIYEIDSAADKMYEYECSTAWEISSCNYNGISIDVQDNGPRGIAISTDGTRLYETGLNQDKIFEYNLGAYIAGRVGVGTDAPDTELDVVGTMQRGSEVGFLYDSGGGQSISNSSWTTIEWDSLVRSDGFTVSIDLSGNLGLSFNKPGWYRIEAECTGEKITSDFDMRITTTYRLTIGGTEVDGSRAKSYHRTTADGRDTASISLLYEETSSSGGISLQAQIDQGVLETVADGCRMYVERV